MALTTPYYQDAAATLYQAKAEAILPFLPDASIDLIVTDPPYFRVKSEWWDRQWDSRDGFLAWLRDLCGEWRRVLKPNGSLYVFASPDMAWHVEGVVRESFNVLNQIRWVKEDGWHQKAEKEGLRSFLSPWEAVVFAEQFWTDEAAEGEVGYYSQCKALHKDVYAPLGRYIQTERERAGLTRNEVEVALGHVSTAEPTRGTALCYRWEEGSSLPTKEAYERLRALLNERGRKPAEYLRRDYEYLRRDYEDLRRPFFLTGRAEWSDVWRFRPVPARHGKHPCEKPLALAEHVIRTSSRPGAAVLDCFAGSGAFLVAARNLGRQAIGVEVGEKHCRTVLARLSQAVLPLMAAD